MLVIAANVFVIKYNNLHSADESLELTGKLRFARKMRLFNAQKEDNPSIHMH